MSSALGDPSLSFRAAEAKRRTVEESPAIRAIRSVGRRSLAVFAARDDTSLRVRMTRLAAAHAHHLRARLLPVEPVEDLREPIPGVVAAGAEAPGAVAEE